MKFIIKCALTLSTVALASAPSRTSDETYFELLDGYGYPYELNAVNVPIKIYNPKNGYKFYIDQHAYGDNTNHVMFDSTINVSGSDSSKIIEGEISYQFLRDYESGRGMRLDFILKDNYFNVIQTNSFILTRPNNRSIDTSNYLSRTYNVTGYALSIKNKSVVSKETLDIPNSKFTYSINEDNSLNLSEMYLDYPSGYTLTNLSGEHYFYIYDPDSLYVNFTHSYGYFKVPIYCSQSNDLTKINFSFKSLYYNPDTLEMSPTKLNGYYRSNQFYVVNEKKALFESSKNYIYLETIMLSRVNVTIDTLNFEKEEETSFGLCGNSSYCVTGGIKE